MRRGLSPGAALTSFRSAMELDVRDVLGAVRVPTLVLAAAAIRDARPALELEIRGGLNTPSSAPGCR